MVRGVNVSVNKALGSTIQSLNTLPQILSGVGEMYEQLLPSGIPLAPESGVSAGDPLSIECAPPNAKQDIATKRAELQIKHAELVTAMRRLENGVQRLTPKVPSADLSKCGLDVSKIKNAVTVAPDVLNFTIEDNRRLSVLISGGNGNYVASANSDKLDIKQNIPFVGRLLSVKWKGSEPGTYMITVQDSADRSSLVTVNVTETQQTSDSGQTPTGAQQPDQTQGNCAMAKDGLRAGEETICGDTEKTAKLQTILKEDLGLEENTTDGKPFLDRNYGQHTRKAVEDFLTKYPYLGTTFSKLVFVSIFALGEEKNRTEEETLQLAAALPGTGSRYEKVVQFQSDNKLDPTGFINEKTMEKICEIHNPANCQ